MKCFRTVGKAGEGPTRVLVHMHPIYEIINFIFWNKDCFGRKVLFYSSYWDKKIGKRPSIPSSWESEVQILGKSAVAVPCVREKEP